MTDSARDRLADAATRMRQVRRLAGAIVADAHLADDLTQQLFAQRLARPAPTPRNERPFLAGILRNLLKGELRSDRRRRARERQAARDEQLPSAADAVEHAETLQRTVAACLALDEPYRTTLLLRYLHDMEVADVARAMAVPQSTVRVRCKRGLDVLRARLQACLGAAWLGALQRFAAPATAAAGAEEVVTISRHAPATRTTMSTLSFSAVATLALAIGGVLLTRTHPFATVAAWSDGAAGDGARARTAAPPTPRLLRTAAGSTAVHPTESAVRAAAAAIGETSGRVVDGAGNGVAGARVRLLDRPFQADGRVAHGGAVAVLAEAATDADGRYAFAGVAADEHRGVVVDAAGFAQATVDQPAGDPLTVRLRPPTAVHGTVVAADGSGPIAGAELRVPAFAIADGRAVCYRSCLTADDGSFRLAGIAALDPLVVEVLVDGALPLPKRLAPTAGDYRCELVVGAPVRRELAVVDAATGAPVVGAEVSVRGHGRDRVGVTDAGGRCPLPLRARARSAWDFDDRSSLVVTAAGHCAVALLTSALSGGEGSLVVAMPPGGRIRGRVTDAAGGPLAGVAVDWQTQPRTFLDPATSPATIAATAAPGPDGQRAVTDRDGRFELGDMVASGFGGALRLQRAGLPPLLVEDVLPNEPGAVRELSLVYRGGHALRGSVDRSGAAVGGYVYLSEHAGPRLRRMTKAAPDGSWTIAGLPAGRYLVHACSDDGTVARSVPIPVEVADRDIDDVALHILVETAYARGRVLLDSGAPLAGAEVVAFADGRGRPGENPRGFSSKVIDLSAGGMAQVASVARIDAGGDFALPLPTDPERRYRLCVFVGGFAIEQRAVAPGASDVELRVPPTAAVRLTVLGADDGRPVDEIDLRWRHPASGREVVEGRRPTLSGVLLTELPLGALELTVGTRAGGSQTTRLDVQADGSTALTLRL